MAKIIINKSHYFHNLQTITNHIGDKNKIAVVLKDNAYGHGLLEIAKLANEFGIKNAVVRNVEEAKKIETLFEQILILADSNLESYSHTFHIAINGFEDIKRLPEKTNVHLKVDTGMHRNGFLLEELEEAIHGLLEKKLILTGVFTHFRSADELSCEFFWQRSVFIQAKNLVESICEKLFLPIPKFHCANSSALFRFKNYNFDMARIGIAQYGYLDTNPIFDNPELKPVMSLWANKIVTRELKKNQKVGYSGKFVADENIKISTYDVGYGDGFLRLNGDKQYYTPKGYRVLGKVSMDNISVDSIEDEICIFDDVKELAKIHNTISYEITTTLNPNLPKEVR
ncbi:alanine racemase [Halarcobacter ebronensis]|uniref:Alanine racemase n=1 Tax=Halarcobacter ebronensis TaxID=1462615 RepID=A0A4Q1AI90_9BACT|nr:alanine racemase [Halarcobacter ebronensis]QKF81470.1 alanine racemase [Halarcobacter ebronensis]RXK02468.1 alanine racemase [Halarcobacter ebronensis]